MTSTEPAEVAPQPEAEPTALTGINQVALRGRV